MDAKETNIIKPLRRTPGLGNQYRPFHSKSKEKFLNDKSACICHPRNKFSRVPKVSRIPLNNLNTITLGVERKLDDSGDNKAGTSNPSSPKELTFEKSKPSHIPRRKSSFNTDRDKPSTPKNSPNFLGESRNVQRVQLLINQDQIRSEEKEKAVSIACTRPIPTLGQIYARNNVIHSDRLNDWFVELDTPANSMDSNMFAHEHSSETSQNYELKNLNINLSNNVVVYENTTARRLCRPDENMSEWLKTDIEYPTKDNESGRFNVYHEVDCKPKTRKFYMKGYRSMSPNTYKPTDVKSKGSKSPSVTEIVKNEPEFKEIEIDLPTSDAQKPTLKKNDPIEISFVNIDNKSAGQLKEQPTKILTKTDVSAITDFNALITKNNAIHNNENNNDISKNCQYPSTVTCPVMMEDRSQIPVPSYVDCPSEVLQKTTNFEGCDTPPTISSVGGGLDLEIRDNLSSHFTIEHDDHITDWCSQSKSCDISDKVDSETTSMTDSLLCNLLDDDADGNLVKRLDHHHTCWKGFQGDASEQCKKCQRYRKFPSSRYRLPTTLSSLKRRLSIHHCRLRLNRVWKKTTERWSVWSKSPHRIRKARIMNYLQRAHIWEDADVQTNVFLYTETGTDSVMKEQKSACISAIFYGSTCLACKTKKPGKKVSPELTSNINSTHRHLNMGPSMFPFFRNSRITKRAISKKKIRDNLCYNCSQKVPSETIDVQTKDSMKDTNNRGVDEHSRDSISLIEISEIAVQERCTSMEDTVWAPQMQNKVTSTFIYLDGIKVVNVQPRHVHTQICVPCHSAETDVELPHVEYHSNASVSLSTDENVTSNLDATQSSGTYTVDKPVVKRSVDVMTSLEPKRTLNHISTQISLKKMSTAVVTSKCWKFVENCDVPIYTHFKRKDKKERHLIEEHTDKKMNKNKIEIDFANQVSQQISCFKFEGNQSTTTQDPVQESANSVHGSIKKCSNTGVSTDNTVENINNSEPLHVCRCSQIETSNKAESENKIEPLHVCQCSQIEVMSQGTEPYKNKITTSIQTKLDTYFNTGMLVNTLVEDAMYRNVPKSSVSIDANPIGNKGMSNISTYTNTQLKDSAMETEKDIFLQQPITVCACGYPEKDLNSQQQSRFKPSSIIIQRSTNTNIIEPEKYTKSSAEISNSIFSQNNSKPFENINTYYIDKQKKSITQTEPEQLAVTRDQQLINNVSSYNAEREIINAPSKDTHAYSKHSTNTNSVINVRKETKSIEQNKNLVKKSINISAINVERVTKSIEQSRENINVVCKKSIDVSTHVQQETKSVVQSKAGLARFNTFDNKLTNNSTQYSNIDVSSKDSTALRLDKMGQSRLLSIRTLGVNANEIYVQTDPVRIDDGPICRPNTNINRAVLTSHYTLNSDAPRITVTRGLDVIPPQKKDGNKMQRSIRGQYSSNMESRLRLDTSAIVSSDLDADKWLKSCIEKGYRSHLEIERANVRDRQEQEQDGAVEKHLLEENVEQNSNESLLAPPAQTRSVKNIDTNDLVSTTNFSQQQLVPMVDNKTSDETYKKEVKEMTLQVTPEKSEAATDCIKPLIEQKSECVFTSQCILPPFSRCGCHNLRNCGSTSQDCLFVYGMPTCIVHRQNDQDAAVQISSSKFPQKYMTQKVSCQVPSELLIQDYDLRSVGLLTSSYEMKTPRCHKQTSYKEVLPPKVYEALYESSKLIIHESKINRPSVCFCKVEQQSSELSKIDTPSSKGSKISSTPSEQLETNPPPIIKVIDEDNITLPCSGIKLDKEVEALILTRPEVRSATVLTSRNNQPASVQCNELLNVPVSGEPQPEKIGNYPHGVFCPPHTKKECKLPNDFDPYRARLLDMPTHEGEDDCKSQLVTSCRYYSKLLTKQLDKVKENLARHLATSGHTYANYTYQIPNVYTHQHLFNEACTMKPSAREEFGCQTFKFPVTKSVKSTGILSQAVSLTDICRYDKQSLKSIYFMLSAIEGRIRRIKNNID